MNTTKREECLAKPGHDRIKLSKNFGSVQARERNVRNIQKMCFSPWVHRTTPFSNPLALEPCVGRTIAKKNKKLPMLNITISQTHPHFFT